MLWFVYVLISFIKSENSLSASFGTDIYLLGMLTFHLEVIPIRGIISVLSV